MAWADLIDLDSNREIFSALTLKYLDANFVYKALLTNKDYEGEVVGGNTVNAFYVGDVTISTYSGGWTDADWQSVDDTKKTLDVDQLKLGKLKVQDTTQRFSVLDLRDQVGKRAAQGFGNVIDQFVASQSTSASGGDATEIGSSGSPVVVGFGPAEILPSMYLELLYKNLFDNKSPYRDNANVVIPSWLASMLTSELGNRVTAYGDAVIQGGSRRQSGVFLDKIGQFNTVGVSPNVPVSGGVYSILGGGQGITFAMALEKFELQRALNDFAYLMKWLMVYGANILRAEFMICGNVTKGSYVKP